jgi:hypothetical protein
MIPYASGADPQLQDVLAARFGVGRRVVSVERHPSPYRSSFVLDDIVVHLDDGTTSAFIAKAIRWDAMSPEAHRAKPQFMWDPERERATYESILAPLDVGAARYCGSYESRSGLRYLLLERVPGAPLWQFGEIEAWREAARWLARLHVHVPVDIAARSAAAAHLLQYDRQFYDCWMHRARLFQDEGSALVAPIAGPHSLVADWLSDQAPAFLHGEFYASNVLVDRRSATSFVVRPVDWEMAALGPPLMDLACLLAGRWSDQARADVADAYHQERAAAGGEVPRREDYLRTLDYCLIHLSIRNLGWSRDWSPPPERDHDWLGEALRLCDKWHL